MTEQPKPDWYPLMEELTARRIACGITKSEVSRHIGMNQSTLCKAESGTRRLAMDQMIKYAEAVGLAVTLTPINPDEEVPRWPWARRFWSKVDKTGTCWLWRGSTNNMNYGMMSVGGRYSRMHLAHRLSYQLKHGEIPDGLYIDHICHVRLCVNPDHLRLASPKQNIENHQGAQSNSGSGYRGVYRRGGRWSAQVQHHGKIHYAGLYDSPEEANAVAQALRKELFTHNDWDRREGEAS